MPPATRGSPPRVRGKLYGGYPERISARITPACAGKTGSALRVTPVSEDHPRVCGENRRDPKTMSGKAGSPPRVRGKPCATTESTRGSRITPACAGKTGERGIY